MMLSIGVVITSIALHAPPPCQSHTPVLHYLYYSVVYNIINYKLLAAVLCNRTRMPFHCGALRDVYNILFLYLYNYMEKSVNEHYISPRFIVRLSTERNALVIILSYSNRWNIRNIIFND